MSTEIPLTEVEKLKEILCDLSEARSQLQANLDCLQAYLQDASYQEQEPVQSKGEQWAELQRLRREHADIRQELDRAHAERDKARRDNAALQDRIAAALRKGTRDVYRVINRQDPFQQLDRLRQGKRNSDKKTSVLNREITELRHRVADLEVQLARLEGLTNRYKYEIASHEAQLERIRVETRRDVLRNLILQITPRRLATLMSVVEDPARTVSIDEDIVKVVEWLVKHLLNSGITVTHQQGERLIIKEEALHEFLLAQEFRPGSVFQVLTPGFRLGDEVLIETKVRQIGEENGDEQQEAKRDESAEGV